MGNKIKPNETKIIGAWVLINGNVEKDANCKRVEMLILNYLKQIKQSKDGWSTLYKDMSDGRYWELTYLESAQHGGGAPSLLVQSKDELRKKYGIG